MFLFVLFGRGRVFFFLLFGRGLGPRPNSKTKTRPRPNSKKKTEKPKQQKRPDKKKNKHSYRGTTYTFVCRPDEDPCCSGSIASYWRGTGFLIFLQKESRRRLLWHAFRAKMLRMHTILVISVVIPEPLNLNPNP